VANGKKSSIIKVLIILFGHLWEVELTYRYIFVFKFTLRYSSSLIFSPLFATGVIDTASKFVDTGGNLLPVSLTPAANLQPVSLTPVANLPPVSTTLAKLLAKFAAGVVDTCGKFSACVVNTGGAP
jgi:hypothetical protein